MVKTHMIHIFNKFFGIGNIRLEEPKLPVKEEIHAQTINNSNDIRIHATGNLILSSDQHVIINSGQGKEIKIDGREGYNWGVWLNPELDEAGWPIMNQEQKSILFEDDNN